MKEMFFFKYYKQNHLSSFYHAEFLSALNAKKSVENLFIFISFPNRDYVENFIKKLLPTFWKLGLFIALNIGKSSLLP